MYGMVNKAIQDLVEKQFGKDAWERIRLRADICEEVFIGTEIYSDSVTYQLVGAASEELHRAPEQILESLGVHWVLHTAAEHYGYMMEAAGRTFSEFMGNLPMLHDRIILIFPRMSPPGFAVRDHGPSSLILEYRSIRPGLQPFIIGLIKGLGTFFSTDIDVTLIAGRTTGMDHDEFSITWKEPAEQHA